MKEFNIPALDLIIILAYLCIIILIGIISARRKNITSEGFFLAGRSLNWGMIGAALFAANISTIHMVGLAANGFKDGIVWGNFEWMATFLLIILALFFAPFYFKNKISTLPEFLEKRYGPKTRSFFAFIVIITALFSHIGISLYAGAVVLKTFFGIDIMVSILVISFITTLYSILGGLRAIVVIETFQSVILIGGAALLTILSIGMLGDQGIHSIGSITTRPAGYSAKRQRFHPTMVCHTTGISGIGNLLLVRRSNHCAKSAWSKNDGRCSEWASFCRFSENSAGIHYGSPGDSGLCPVLR